MITLAIGSALLLSGMYYGNEAYQDAKAEAYAQQIVSGAATIANAWQQWSKDNGGVTALADYNWQDGTATDLIPNYLSILPKVPQIIIFNQPGVGVCNSWSPIKFSKFALNTSCVNNYTPVDAFSYNMGPKGKRVCEKITEIARGKGSTPVTTSAPGGFIDLTLFMSSNKTFDCVNYSTQYHFVYRVFQ